MKIFVSVVLLSFALAGFYLLNWFAAFLWLVFLIAAYPLCLTVFVNPPKGEHTILAMYKHGVNQLPMVGNALTQILTEKKEDGENV